MSDVLCLASYPDGVRWDLDIEPTPVQRILDDAIAKWPDQPAIEFMGKRLSYRELGQLADRAAKGLQQLGNESWAQTNASGQAVNGVAGNSGFGTIASGSVEESNVDTTSALVAMIKAQRDFQVNAQMIQTDNQITQTIINIRQ